MTAKSFVRVSSILVATRFSNIAISKLGGRGGPASDQRGSVKGGWEGGLASDQHGSDEYHFKTHSLEN